MNRILVYLLFVISLGACSAPQALQYRDLTNFRIHKMDFQQIVIVANLRFYNPNNYGLNLKNGNLDAYINNKYIGKAEVDESVAVPAKDEFIMPVTLTASLPSLLKDAFDLLSLQKQDVLVRLQGNIRAGKGGVFIGVPINYEGKQRLQI
jgi:LEA14-like dessication related protein